jgi:Asp-tRNA(Asn)/Glu-tRNA(Gln) amidotransferase A subunit family amidase
VPQGFYSRRGVISFADSLDCVGIMSKKVADARKVFGQHDPAWSRAVLTI